MMFLRISLTKETIQISLELLVLFRITFIVHIKPEVGMFYNWISIWWMEFCLRVNGVMGLLLVSWVLVSAYMLYLLVEFQERGNLHSCFFVQEYGPSLKASKTMAWERFHLDGMGWVKKERNSISQIVIGKVTSHSTLIYYLYFFM